MDNKRIDVTSEGPVDFETVFSLFDNKTVAYTSTFNRLTFYWVEAKNTLKLPYPMLPAEAAKFAYNWLKHSEYGPKPDIDGSCKHGWRIFNEAWGHVGGHSEAFIAIEPAWAMYGK